MKTIRLIVTLFCASTALFAQGIGGALDRREEPYFVITYIEGTAQLRPAKEGQWRAAKIGDVLAKDDIVRTARNGTAILTITKGGSLTLREESVLLFERHSYDPVFKTEETVVKLRAGRARVIRPSVSATSSFFFLTPNQATKILGADMAVETDGRASTVSVFDGEAHTAHSEGIGAPVRVTKGKTVATGQKTPSTAPTDIPAETYIDWKIAFERIPVLDDVPRQAEPPPSPIPSLPAQPPAQTNDAIQWQQVDEPAPLPPPLPVPPPPLAETNAEEQTNAPVFLPAETNAQESAEAELLPEKKRRVFPKGERANVPFKFSMGGTVGVAYLNDKANNGPFKHIWIPLTLIPEIRVGPIGIGFFLPFYFPLSIDFYMPEEWYNYEDWDDLTDIFSKIYYAEINWRPVQFRVGALHELTFGNGYYLDGYLNSFEFPESRYAGAYFKFDCDVFGLELFDADIARNNFVGARVFTRPFAFLLWPFEGEEQTKRNTAAKTSFLPTSDDFLAGIQLGFSFIYDAAPFTEQTWTMAGRVFNGNSIRQVGVYAMNLDFGVPLFDATIFDAKLYADWGGLGLKFGKADMEGEGPTADFYKKIPRELKLIALVRAGATEGVYESQTKLGGYGAAFGVKGSVAIVPWKAELRYNSLGNMPSFFDALYYDEAMRLERMLDLYIKDQMPSFGLLGETGVAYPGVGSVLVNYYEALNTRTGKSEGNRLRITAALEKGAVNRFYGSLMYEQRDVTKETFTKGIFFNEKSVIRFELGYTLFGPFSLDVLYMRRFQLDGETKALKAVDSATFSVGMAF